MHVLRKTWENLLPLARAGVRERFWAAGFAMLFIPSLTALGQGLNWEGQSGALITPFAYTSSSPSNNFGRPQISFHFLNTGPVVGNNIQVSATVGFGIGAPEISGVPAKRVKKNKPANSSLCFILPHSFPLQLKPA